ncbi:GNAT family N-acetyltransferase [Anaerolineales bacterium]
MTSSATPLITYYLHMTQVSDFSPAFLPPNDALEIKPLLFIDIPFYRFLYHEVGHQWRWLDRQQWSDERLADVLNQTTVHIDVLYFQGAPAGYVELNQIEDLVEIAYFGLRPPFLGQGLGKHLLSDGIQKAWQDLGAHKVSVHTCNLDGPHAYQNYVKRGFSLYETKQEPMPALYK